MWGDELFADPLWGDQPGDERIAAAASAVAQVSAQAFASALALAMSASTAHVDASSPTVTFNLVLPLGTPVHADASVPSAALAVAMAATAAGASGNAPTVVFLITLPGSVAGVTGSVPGMGTTFAFQLALASALATVLDGDMLTRVGFPNHVSFLLDQKEFVIVTFTDDAQRPVLSVSGDETVLVLSAAPGQQHPVASVSLDEPSIILKVEA